MKKPVLKRYPLLRNKFLLTFIGFLVWLTFFDRNDFITTWSYRHKLHQLRSEKEYFTKEIEKSKTDLNDLMNNNGNLEKFGREKYCMKRDKEEVYVLVDESKVNPPVKK